MLFSMEDKELINQHFQGNEVAFQQLVERYFQEVYNFAYYYVQNQSYAEDITQEVFLKVWNGLKSFDLQKSFKTWLFTITKNCCLDFLRKKKILPFSALEQEDKIFEIADTAPLPLEALKQADQGTILQKALATLPLKYREVLLFYYQEHFNFREIADILKESLNTVKSRHRRALEMMKKLLSKKFL